MSIVTYHIVSDYRGMLRNSAKLSCSFWNRFVEPQEPIVIRLGTFTQWGSTIARAYRPTKRDGVIYGRVEFNTQYLDQFDEDEIIGTLVHEIGHTLGIGWDKWMSMFHHDTGKFKNKWIKKLSSLEEMLVETDYGPGTELSHWDEETFGKELMSGIKNGGEHVLPVTIDVLELLGHKVIERLESKHELSEILNDLRSVTFSRQSEASKIARDVYIETEIWEEIYNNKRLTIREKT